MLPKRVHYCNHEFIAPWYSAKKWNIVIGGWKAANRCHTTKMRVLLPLQLLALYNLLRALCLPYCGLSPGFLFWCMCPHRCPLDPTISAFSYPLNPQSPPSAAPPVPPVPAGTSCHWSFLHCCTSLLTGEETGVLSSCQSLFQLTFRMPSMPSDLFCF